MAPIDIRGSDPPAAWGVTIDRAAVERLADALAGEDLPTPAWDYPGLPKERTAEGWVDLCLVAVSVVGCLWPPQGHPPWTIELDGETLTDASAIWGCFVRDRAWSAGRLDLERFATMDETEGPAFFAGEGTLQYVTERVARMRAVARALLGRRPSGGLGIVSAADGDAERLVERMVAEVPGYRDRPITPLGEARFDKLARLATAMIAAEVPLEGIDRLPVYPDYMLPRYLRHHGVLVYDDELARIVDRRRLLPPGSTGEVAIRWATIRAGDLLVDALRARGVDVTAPQLDFRMWWEAVMGPDAAAMGEHHRTPTLTY